MAEPSKIYNPDDYLTPEIAQALPMLDESFEMLTQFNVIEKLTEAIKKWVMGDPELADILVEGKKNLAECVRYVYEKMSVVAMTQANSMTKAQIDGLVKQTIHGKEARMLAVGAEDEKIFEIAKEYLYNPDKKPSDVTKSTPKAGAGKGTGKGAGKKTAASNKGGTKTKTEASAGAKSSAGAAAGADAPDDGAAVDEAPEQMDLFGASGNAA